MRKIMNDKRGVLPLVFIVLGIVVVFYLILFLPIPAFKKIRAMINYFSILAIFLVLQAGIVYGYYKLGNLISKGVLLYNTKIANLTINIRKRIDQTSMF